ncbi:MAG TPA: cytochrome C oxidase subunit IV family protein [Rhizobiaceae bacterium]|nr:cytochrome C oxidase subunit IV family protein [Rhizobiaceae bacterium]
MRPDSRQDAVRLWRVFAALMALTVLWSAGRGLAGSLPSVLLLAGLAVVTALKAWLVLEHYLGLREAPAWRGAFGGLLVALLVLVFGLLTIPYL